MGQASLREDEIARLREMLDRAEILQVMNDYCHSMDARNLGLLERVFAKDATYEVMMIDQPAIKIEGYEQIVSAIANVAMFRTSHHGMRNMSIRIDADRASVNILAEDTLHELRAAGDDSDPVNRLIQHGSRYIDRLERREQGWRIVHRQLHVLWEVVLPGPKFAPVLPPW